jgi:adenylate kinase
LSMCSSPSAPALPNVLVTGTPGCGKTSLCRRLAELSGLRHVEIGELVRERGLHDGWNERFQCFDLNDDKVSSKAGRAAAGFT